MRIILNLFNVALLGVLLMTIAAPVDVSAHTLRVDGSIGVTVHINPDDEPIRGSASDIMIGINDKEGRFAAHANECICVVTVLLDGSVVEAVPFVASGESSMLTYTFQNSGIYRVEVAGSPRTPRDFQSFSTEFSYRVKGEFGIDTPASKSASQNQLRKYTPFAVIGAASFLAVLFMWPMKKHVRKRSSGT